MLCGSAAAQGNPSYFHLSCRLYNYLMRVVFLVGYNITLNSETDKLDLMERWKNKKEIGTYLILKEKYLIHTNWQEFALCISTLEITMESGERQATHVFHRAEDSFLFVLKQFVHAPTCTLQISKATLRQEWCADPLWWLINMTVLQWLTSVSAPPSHLDFPRFSGEMRVYSLSALLKPFSLACAVFLAV